MNRIKLIKYIHLYISIIIFSILLLYTLHTKQLNITEISLSRLGINDNGWIWNIGLIGIASLLYFKIRQSVTKFTNSLTLQRINKFLILNLLLTSIVDMNHSLHNFVALAYFLAASILIFLFGVKIHRTNFRIGQLSLIIAILSVLLPSVSFPIIKTLAIPETIHIVMLFSWLIILEHDDTTIKFLKKIGF